MNPIQEDLQIAGAVLGSMFNVDLAPSTTKNAAINLNMGDINMAKVVHKHNVLRV